MTGFVHGDGFDQSGRPPVRRHDDFEEIVPRERPGGVTGTSPGTFDPFHHAGSGRPADLADDTGDIAVGEVVPEIGPEDRLEFRAFGDPDFDFPVETAGAQQRVVDMVEVVGRRHEQDRLRTRSQAIDLQ